MAANPSLLETLKELENLSRVEVQDPEDEDFEAGRVSVFQETEETEQNRGAENKFGNLRKTLANEVLDKKYAGKRSSRKSLLTWSDEEDNVDEEVEPNDDDDEDDDADEDEDDTAEDEDDDNDGYEAGDINEEVAENGDGDYMMGADGKGRNGDMDQLESDSDNGDDDDKYDDDEDDDDEDDDDEGDDGVNDLDDDDNAMNIDFSKLPADLQTAINETKPDSDEPPSHFTSSAKEDDIKKGQATKSQLDILDKLLESRIRLQKSLQICNQLPQHDTMQGFRNQSTSQVKESYEAVKTSMKELLNKLLDLQEKLCETNSETSAILTTGNVTSTDPGDEEIPSDTEDEDEEETEKDDPPKNELNLPSKRKHTLTVKEYGEEVVKRHKAFQIFQETTINKWHEKTRLATSVSKNFASFDKSVTQQIRQVLMDKERLVKRTQLSRVPLKILGKPAANVGTELKSEDSADLHLKNYDENIFDDGDFYHEMLKELIERKSNIDADDPVAAGRRWLELQKLRSKIKRKVDTRASKGRKVRYDVHTKLVNFMAPQNVGTMGDQARNNLFASLFGQKTTIGIGS